MFDSTISTVPLPSTIVLHNFKALASFVLIALLGYVVVPLFIRKNIVDKDGHPIPPGPLLRYAFLRKYSERALYAWAKQYGPIYSLFMGNQLFVVLNDPHVAKDILVTNGAIFSSRKNYFMKNQTILRGGGVTAAQYNDTWRKHRKIAMWLLTPKAIEKYAHVLDYEAHIMVRSLFRDTKQGLVPVNPHHYAGRYVLNNMLTVSFGMRTDSTDDPLVSRALYLADEFMQLTGPFSNIVDFIKPLQWLPTSERTRGRNLYNGLITVYGAMINQVKERLDNGENVPDCLVKTLLEVREKEDLSWEDMCMLCAVYILGGVHSTSSIIQWCLAMMPSHPEIQAKAHEELDRVMGRETWPTAEDEHKLPYLRAIIKEIERVHSPFLIATPHYSTEDFVYNGYYIPKDTAVILNTYTLHHNEERYPNATKFSPERYIDDKLRASESAKLGDPMQRDHWAFGAGRRFCPGVVVAEHELWLAISRLLWCFKIEALPNEPISLEEYEGLSGRHPLPYRVKLIPRHEGVAAMIDSKDETQA
ncbi:cytochrome P450 [Pluteus cervinus]|uniref:Cytochrome P450 n=1 Tax=Pluteus cervinus TaxID=181527 RepID=A0ACD3AMX1_9AGAR|nr:cytochrome P450 [Pluteus cervinus]